MLGTAFGLGSSFELTVRVMRVFLSGRGGLRFSPGIAEGGYAGFSLEIGVLERTSLVFGATR